MLVWLMVQLTISVKNSTYLKLFYSDASTNMPTIFHTILYFCLWLYVYLCYSATATMDAKENGKVGALMLGYVIVTNTVASGVGTLLAATAKPGW